MPACTGGLTANADLSPCGACAHPGPDLGMRAKRTQRYSRQQNCNFLIHDLVQLNRGRVRPLFGSQFPFSPCEEPNSERDYLYGEFAR